MPAPSSARCPGAGARLLPKPFDHLRLVQLDQGFDVQRETGEYTAREFQKLLLQGCHFAHSETPVLMRHAKAATNSTLVDFP